MQVVDTKHLIIMHQAPYKWDWDKYLKQCLSEVAKIQEGLGLTSEVLMFFFPQTRRLEIVVFIQGFSR